MKKIQGIKWYGYNDGVIPGAKADTTVDVVDTFAVELEEGIEPGDAVTRGTDVDLQVKKAKSGDEVVGVAVHVHKEPKAPYFEQGDSIGVMTFGDIWVEVAADVKAGELAALDANGKFVKSSDATASGMHFLTSAKTGEMAILRIRK